MSHQPRPARLSTMRDRLLHRCTWCGDWRYGQQACSACGTADPVSLDELPRRPNVGTRAS
jgi:hypothetical protein